jgi:hypothetical protein
MSPMKTIVMFPFRNWPDLDDVAAAFLASHEYPKMETE